ncbi:hypothetical protein [Trichocoleus sp. Lan]
MTYAFEAIDLMEKSQVRSPVGKYRFPGLEENPLSTPIEGSDKHS